MRTPDKPLATPRQLPQEIPRLPERCRHLSVATGEVRTYDIRFAPPLVADAADSLHNITHRIDLRLRHAVLDAHFAFLVCVRPSETLEVSARLARAEMRRQRGASLLAAVAQPDTFGRYDGPSAADESLRAARENHIPRVQGDVQLCETVEMGPRLAARVHPALGLAIKKTGSKNGVKGQQPVARGRLTANKLLAMSPEERISLASSVVRHRQR